ncbi:MAG: transcription termination factor NusA [Anaerolineaceae bacterium]|jgi:N utilization substance protein A|nr:transcription termination factor NusA [Anaerolineaceae bacterium]
MKNDFVLAFNEVIEERQLPREVILQALESAMVSAYRRSVNASNAQQVEAKVDQETGEVIVHAEKEVVETVQDERTEVSLEEAKQVAPEAEIGSMVMIESTPEDFGRVAAQTARQVIQQRIRDAERQLQLDFYETQLGEIISGVVQAINSQGLTIGLEMHAEGTMRRKDMIPRERFRIHDRVRALVAEVKNTPRGPQILLSRTHRDFLRRLLENEVPEIYHGVVEIRSIAREPGERAKVAVSATQGGIDPVGACVGIRGVRIQAIVKELHDEKIDVIEWNPDSAAFIAKAISPARVLGVYLNETPDTGRTATVVVPEDQLSLAIGRDGQNARLAAKLTNWRIDIKSLSEAAGDVLYKLQQNEALAELAEAEKENVIRVEEMLARKSEGRPLSPEDYDFMSKFVDRIEKQTTVRIAAPKPEVPDTVAEDLRAAIPEKYFAEDLLEVEDLPEHIANIIQEAEIRTMGDLFMAMHKDPDQILKLQGIGPRSMEKIEALVAGVEAEMAPAEAMETAADVVSESEAVAQPVADETAEAVIEPAAEPDSTAEEVVDAAVVEEPVVEEPAAEETAAVEAPAEEEKEEEMSFEDLFKMQSEAIIPDRVVEDDELEDEELGGKGKGKKKKKKRGEIVYDPETDLTIRKKRHKRGEDDWGDW